VAASYSGALYEYLEANYTGWIVPPKRKEAGDGRRMSERNEYILFGVVYRAVQ